MMRHRQAVRQGTLTPPSQVRLLLAQLKTPHGGFRASVRGFCCLDGKSYAREAKPSQGPCFPFCCTGRPAALPRRKKPPARRASRRSRGSPKGLRPLPPDSEPGSGPPRRPWFPCRPQTAPAGLQWSRAPAPAGPARRTGPWDSRRG